MRRPTILGNVDNGLEYRDGTGPDWRDTAVCAQIGPALFFPPAGGNTSRAKAVCALCPAVTRAACREWAIEHHEQGIWGGTTERDRRDIRTERRRGAA